MVGLISELKDGNTDNLNWHAYIVLIDGSETLLQRSGERTEGCEVCLPDAVCITEYEEGGRAGPWLHLQHKLGLAIARNKVPNGPIISQKTTLMHR